MGVSFTEKPTPIARIGVTDTRGTEVFAVDLALDASAPLPARGVIISRAADAPPGAFLTWAEVADLHAMLGRMLRENAPTVTSPWAAS